MAENLFGQEEWARRGEPVFTSAGQIAAGTFGPGVLIPAGQVTAGTFGSGNFTFPATLDVTGILRLRGTGVPGPNRFWDGLELAHPSSTPYIDFHRSTNPEEATDYNVRLINDAAAQLSLVGGQLAINGTTLYGTAGRNYFKDNERSAGAGLRVGAAWGLYGIYSESGDVVVGSATGVVRLNSEGTFLDGNGWTVKSRNYMGQSGAFGTTFAQFSHASYWNSTAYGFMQESNGTLYFSTAGSAYFRVNNTTKASWSGSEFYVGDASNMRFQAFRFDQIGDWTVSAILSSAQGGSTGARITFYSAGQNAAPIFKGWGPDLECRNYADNAYTIIRASAFNVNSVADAKRNIASAADVMPKATRKQKIKAVRPVHYKWKEPASHCANCRGTGLKKNNQRITDEERTAAKSKESCPDCGGDPTAAANPAWTRGQADGWYGFLVDEMVTQFPEVVGWKQHGPGEEPKPEAIDVMGVVALLWEEIKDLEDRLAVIEATPGRKVP